MQHYVLGFMFSEDYKDVVLILKNRPEDQVGKWNGVGGKVELMESPYEAMVREFEEEAGLHFEGWYYFAILYSKHETIVCYHASTDEILKVYSAEDQTVAVIPIDQLPNSIMLNAKWLIPMAISFSQNKRAPALHIKDDEYVG